MNSSTFTVPEHVLEQAYKAIRTTEPEARDLEQSELLQKYMDEHFPTESSDNIKRRSMILAELRATFRHWVKQVCIEKGVPEEVAAEAGGQILVSGSYRLGVNEPGADIDTICVAPRHVTREDFFSSLKDIFVKHPKVSNLVAIESAVVPLLTFDYEEINIDLQIAILPRTTIPDNLNILDDQILVGVDTATEKSLNGPRVTELMIKLTPNRDSFISVLRIVRRWAKRRGIYSNKMGYLGGVNYCILVCFINQLYPTAAPSTLLLRFFMVLAKWKWPHAIQLCKTYDAKLGLEIWNANVGNNRYQSMPILTPAYPSMNSSYNVSPYTLAVLQEEFQRALEVVQEIMNKGATDWSKLFEPSDFFAVHQHYLAVDVYTENKDEEQAWTGFCESRMRKLIDSLAYIPPLCRLRAFPKKFPLTNVECGQDGEKKDGEQPSEKYGVCFFVGFDIDRAQLRSRELSIDSSVDYFKHNDLYRWVKRTPTMDVRITPMLWKNLPECVFEDMGGRPVARTIRRDFLRRKKEEEKAVETPSTVQSASATTDEPLKSQEIEAAPESAADMDMEASQGNTEEVQSPNLASDVAAAASEAEQITFKKRQLDVTTGKEGESVATAMNKAKEDGASAARSAVVTAASSVSPPSNPSKGRKLSSRPMPAPAAAASPRKRRKMKITFAKTS